MTSISRASTEKDPLLKGRRGSVVQVEDEDRDDEALVDARMAELDAGSEVPLPTEVGDRVLNGDSVFVAICAWRGVTSSQLAEKAKLTLGDIAKFENGQALDAAATLRVAAVLQVDPTWLAGV